MFEVIPQCFTQNQYTYTQHDRQKGADGNDYILMICESNKSFWFEVFKVIQCKETTIKIKGKEPQIIPTHEKVPSAEEWGRYGWTARTLPEAQARFKEVLERPKNFKIGEKPKQ
jgi:hypothetical protein